MTQPNHTPILFNEWDTLKIELPEKKKEKTERVYDNKMYSIIYRLRKHSIDIDTAERTIYYTDEESVKRKGVNRLCKEFGFVRQSKI